MPRSPVSRFLPLALTVALLVTAAFAKDPPQPAETAVANQRRLRAGDVFDLRQPTIFQDDFRTGALDRWNFSENDQYELPSAPPDRIAIVDAPGLRGGCKAVRFVVRRAPNSFRSEISLPSENGFQERWYAGRILIPKEWIFDPVCGNDIVMQWHAIPGNWRATYPNLAISISNDRWCVSQSFGSAQTNPTRTTLKLDDPVQRGVWVSWVIHAKWSPGDDGVLQIWRDGKLVVKRDGANVYGTIGVAYTPYLKTGIYHPEWHLTDERKRAAFEKEKPVATTRMVYVTDIKIGGAKATLESVAPAPTEH